MAAGPPVAAAEHLSDLGNAFVQAASAAHRRACFFAVEERFLRSSPQLRAIQIGAQPVWDPTLWAEEVRRWPRLREQLRRARAKGVHVRPVAPCDLSASMRSRIDLLVRRWQGTRSMPPMGFLVEIDLTTDCAERRFYLAERGDEIIGLLALAPVFGRHGWLFEHLLRDAGAPNGTSELLFDGAMGALAREECHYATLGLAPLSGQARPWMAFAGRAGRGLFDFAGLTAFKARLRPRAWTPIYLAYPAGMSELLPVVDSLRAFARGRAWRFALRTLARAPAPVVRLLWVLLVPWIAALASARPRWFPHMAVRWAWVAYDVAMLMGLRGLARRWRPRLATLLASAATADAVLTATQLLLYNAHHLQGSLDYAVAALASAAPALASVLLWLSLAERGARVAAPNRRS